MAASSLPARADYADVVQFFETLHGSADAAVFPVANRDFDDLEGAFGPRIQTTTQNYDWHRGVDIDGALNSDPVVTALEGYFYDYRTTSAGGNIVIVQHNLVDFGVNSLEYKGETFERFFTWYIHLHDDGIANNGVGTGDIVSGWTKTVGDTLGTSLSRGTQVGILGNTGTPAGGGTYGPHLHFELRIATNSSLEFQLEDPVNRKQWGFDPHMNPMFLYEPDALAAAATLTMESPWNQQSGATLLYTSPADQLLLNRFDVEVVDLQNNSIVATHTLDFNQRTGYDATSTENLDDFEAGESDPHVVPVAFGDSSSEYGMKLKLPASWMQPFASPDYRFDVTASTIWGDEVSYSFTAVPEPRVYGICAALALVGIVILRQRRSRCQQQ